MLKINNMKKQPPTFAQQFGAIFTPQRLLMIIGMLSGVIAAKLLGF